MPSSQAAARDVATFAFVLKVSGNEIKQAQPAGLDYLSIEDHCDMIGVAEFTIEAGQGTPLEQIELGEDVEISVAHGSVVFKGHVVELRHALRQGRNTLTVVAMDPLCKLAASRKVATWRDVPDSEVAQQVISSHGVSAGTIDSTRRKHAFTMQRNESSLHFLRRLAARNGFLLMARDGKIDFCAPQFSDPPYELDISQVVSFDYSISAYTIPKEVSVIGWDYMRKEIVQASVADSSVTPIGSGIPLAGRGHTVLWDKSVVSDLLVTDQDSATLLATAEMNRMSRNFLRGRAVVDGNPKFRAGTRVRFVGFEEGFGPDAFIVSSRHRVGPGSSYVTEFAFSSNTRS